MTQPTARTRLYNFTEYATANPGAPYPAAQHDAEANADVTTINQLVTNIGLIQRDDGLLKNASVHQDSFSSAALALIASNFTPRGLWLTATAYVLGDLVQNSTASYVCAAAHTSGTFNTDYTAGKWIILGATAAGDAASITNTPAGNIAATDVQAALNELDVEKALLAGVSTQLFSVAAATSANHAPRASQVQSNSLWFAAAAGTADAMTATIAVGAITALVDGFEVSIRAFGANTLTNPTLNLTLGSTATGALTIVNGITGDALVAGDIFDADHEMLLRYRATGTKWALMNPTGASPTNVGTAGQALLSGGAGVRPAYGTAFTPSASNALAGSIVQVVNTQTGAYSSGTTVMPYDDTIPQNTEGDQYMSLAITPTSATNKLKITVVFNWCEVSNTFNSTTVALFQDATASALAAIGEETAGANLRIHNNTFVHYMTSGTTSATTFKVRAGPDQAGTLGFNGDTAGARLFGGVCASSITIEEVKV